MDITTLWGLIPTVLMIIYFVWNFKKNAKDEDKVDNVQNLEIQKIWGQVDLLKQDINHLKDVVSTNRADNILEFKKIEEKLDAIMKLLLKT